jgi:signal peptidase
MEPAFQRGDILFLNNQDSPIRVGEIVVFKIKDRDIPIVHRVMKVHEKEDGKVISLNLFTMVYRKDADESFTFN